MRYMTFPSLFCEDSTLTLLINCFCVSRFLSFIKIGWPLTAYIKL